MSKNSKVKSEQLSPPLFENQIMRIEQVANMLQFSVAHVYRLVSQKKLPCYKKGKTLFFMRQEILDWIQQGVT